MSGPLKPEEPPTVRTTELGRRLLLAKLEMLRSTGAEIRDPVFEIREDSTHDRRGIPVRPW